jgi:hypothetical protein
MPRDEVARLIKDLEGQMKQAARDLEFEKAAALRDQIIDLRRAMALDEDSRIPLAGEKVGAAARNDSGPTPPGEPPAPPRARGQRGGWARR